MTHRQSYYQRDEDKLEGVQRSATKMIRDPGKCWCPRALSDEISLQGQTQ